MTDRPTPEQIINELLSTRGRAVVVGRRIGQALVKELAEHGYVVIHKSDLRARIDAIIRATIDWRSGEGDETLGDLRKPWPDFDAIIAAAEQGETP